MARGRKTGGRVAGVKDLGVWDIKRITQSYGSEAVQTLVAVMRKTDNEAVKVAACKELLDRGYGKPLQETLNRNKNEDVGKEAAIKALDEQAANMLDHLAKRREMAESRTIN